MTAERVCTIDELEVDTAYRVMMGEIPIAVVKDSSGTVHAIGDLCTHGDISLAEGFVDPQSETIECWAHGSLFSLKTGKPTLPAYEPVPVYVVTVDANGVVYIDPNETVVVS